MPEPHASLDAGAQPALSPTPYRGWAGAALCCLAGACAGWWGEDFLAWRPAGILIGALVAFCSIVAVYDWLRRSWRHVDHLWRWLLVALGAFGLVGGLIAGALCWFMAL